MQEVIHFLQQLQQHNERSWFQAHKDEYQAAQARFNVFAEELIQRLGDQDPSVRGLSVKDCTYRIYRDIRFSKDKSPYKTHFGVYVCPGGKKSGYSGYYFHVGTHASPSPSYTASHFLAIGDYCSDRRVLQVLREDIENGGGDFDRIMRGLPAGMALDPEYRLARVPRGFKTDGPWADWLRYKVYCLTMAVSDSLVTSPDLAERVAALCRQAQPFLEYVNRAVRYVKEEMDGETPAPLLPAF